MRDREALSPPVTETCCAWVGKRRRKEQIEAGRKQKAKHAPSDSSIRAWAYHQAWHWQLGSSRSVIGPLVSVQRLEVGRETGHAEIDNHARILLKSAAADARIGPTPRPARRSYITTARARGVALAAAHRRVDQVGSATHADPLPAAGSRGEQAGPALPVPVQGLCTGAGAP
jgi:hypothetical protein